MIFKKIVLQNFRVFYGRQEVSLYSSQEETNTNLILFGGLNGAGKTSLLNAFKLVLFGEKLLPNHEFKALLDSSINNLYFQEGGRESFIELHIEDREEIRIRLKLYYNNEQKFTHNERTLYSRGRKIQLSDNEFSKYIERKIPSQVAPFFIFDGEKIQELVEKQEDGNLKSAIQNVISLDFYKSALSHTKKAFGEIKLEVSKVVSQRTLAFTLQELEEKEKERDEHQSRINNYSHRIQSLELEREAIRKLRNEKLAISSGNKKEFETKIKNIQFELSNVMKDIENIKKQVHIYMIASLISELKNRIVLEQKKKNSMNQDRTLFKKYNDFIELLLNRLTEYNINDELKSVILQESKKTWAEVNDIRIEQHDDIDIIHDLTTNDMTNILKYNTPALNNIKQLIDRKYSLETEYAQLIQDLKNAPEAVDVTTEDKKIDKLSAEIGVLIVKRKSIEIKLLKSTEEIRKLNRKYNELLANSKVANDIQDVFEFTSKVVTVMEDFVDRVTKYKAQQIAKEFSQIISLIFRKQYDFNRIEFDPEQFAIKIYNEHNRLVRLSDRSAGEKQLIALSLIWALTKCANISIPFVIDTPLGRLDSIHRENLAEHYFPHLSEQVIILSTDTEVNDKYLDPLKENVYKKYQLDYDSIRKVTTLKEGYFN